MTARLPLAFLAAATFFLAAAPARAQDQPDCGVYATSQLSAACQASDAIGWGDLMAEIMELAQQQNTAETAQIAGIETQTEAVRSDDAAASQATRAQYAAALANAVTSARSR